MQKKLRFALRKTSERDIKQVLSLINKEARGTGALLLVRERELRKWIAAGSSYVAVVRGEVVGHEAAYKWPKSGWIELRSAIVKEGYRGNGIYGSLSMYVIDRIRKRRKDAMIVALVNKSGQTRSMMRKAGFDVVAYDDVPKELFTIGPKYRGKKSFGYDIFLLKN